MTPTEPTLAVASVNVRGRACSSDSIECLWSAFNSCDMLCILEADMLRCDLAAEQLRETLDGAKVNRFAIPSGNAIKTMHKCKAGRRMIRGPELVDRFVISAIRDDCLLNSNSQESMVKPDTVAEISSSSSPQTSTSSSSTSISVEISSSCV